MTGWERIAGAALVVTLLVTGCSGVDDPDPSGPESTSPSQQPSPEPGEAVEPLVLAVRASTPAPRISEALARAIVNGSVPTWQQVDGTDRPLRVVHSPQAILADENAIGVFGASRLEPSLHPAYVAGQDPLLAADYPLTTPGPAPPKATTLTVGGDVMLGRRVATAAAAAGDPSAPLRPLARRLAAADITVVTLESTLSDNGSPTQGGDSFSAPPAVRNGLTAAGVDAVSLANNHVGDYGSAAFTETLDLLDRAGIGRFGAGPDLAAAGRPWVADVNGLRIGFVGFNAIGETPRAMQGSWGALSLRMPPRTGPLNRADLQHVLGVVRELDRVADVVVVLPHWGTQYTHLSEPSQRRVGRRLVEAGADLVVGGHPHWVQGLELHRGKVIAHSLGNLVFDMDFMTETQQGILLQATLWGDRVMRVALVPYGIGADFAPRVARGQLAQKILNDVWRNSTGPFRRARP